MAKPRRQRFDSLDQVGDYARDVNAWAVSVPSVELVTLPRYVAGQAVTVVRSGKPAAVLACRARRLDTDSDVAASGVAWRADGNAVKISSVGGLTSGVAYELALLIIGDI